MKMQLSEFFNEFFNEKFKIFSTTKSCEQERTGQSSDAGHRGFYNLPYKMSKKGPFRFFFVWNVAEAF
jgi:hypothetical protein